MPYAFGYALIGRLREKQALRAKVASDFFVGQTILQKDDLGVSDLSLCSFRASDGLAFDGRPGRLPLHTESGTVWARLGLGPP